MGCICELVSRVVIYPTKFSVSEVIFRASSYVHLYKKFSFSLCDEQCTSPAWC